MKSIQEVLDAYTQKLTSKTTEYIQAVLPTPTASLEKLTLDELVELDGVLTNALIHTKDIAVSYVNLNGDNIVLQSELLDDFIFLVASKENVANELGGRTEVERD